MYKEIVHNADDEEPNCNKCDNVDCDYLCVTGCGAEHGWYGYERTEIIDLPSEEYSKL